MKTKQNQINNNVKGLTYASLRNLNMQHSVFINLHLTYTPNGNNPIMVVIYLFTDLIISNLFNKEMSR